MFSCGMWQCCTVTSRMSLRIIDVTACTTCLYIISLHVRYQLARCRLLSCIMWQCCSVTSRLRWLLLALPVIVYNLLVCTISADRRARCRPRSYVLMVIRRLVQVLATRPHTCRPSIATEDTFTSWNRRNWIHFQLTMVYTYIVLKGTFCHIFSPLILSIDLCGNYSQDLWTLQNKNIHNC